MSKNKDLKKELKSKLTDTMEQTVKAVSKESKKVKKLIKKSSKRIASAVASSARKEEKKSKKAAKVKEFIDLILTEWATEEERKIFLEGLVEADRKTNALFGHSFVAASPKEQAAILQVFDEDLATFRNEQLPKQVRAWELTLMLPFFAQMRRLTLVGYYTSPIGQEQELKVEIIPGELHGCVPAKPEVIQ